MTMRRWIVLLALLAMPGCGLAHTTGQAGSTRPALVVMIVVDQLRADLLHRYDPYFTGGFRRLIDRGAYHDAVHDHAASETGPGHAAISTGVVPARSGIVANDWSERVGDRWVTIYNVQDTLAPIVGFLGEQGRSPANLLRTGLADWVRAADPRAGVVSIGGKDRAAILMAGKARGQVYWYNEALGRFVTSRHYATEYPHWVERFNTLTIPTLFDSVWVEESPVAARSLAGPDTARYEADSVHTHFPHRYREEAEAFGGSFVRWANATPWLDRAVLGLVREAMAAEALGRDRVTDFLAIGLSQTDRVGHRYGPNSREQLDNLIRLDRELGEFFDHLDATVGRGRWVAGLSADHGATTMPEWDVARGHPGRRVRAEDRAQIAKVAEEAAKSAAPGRASEAVARALRQLPFVADAYTIDEIARGEPRDSFVALYRKSYYPGRPGSELARDYGVELRAREWTYLGAATGTGHGGPYFLDRYVPLIFLGGRVAPSRPRELARTVDLAPTLASLAGIPAPADLDGRTVAAAGER